MHKHDGKTIFCTMCPTPLSPERLKQNAVTCCIEHAEEHRVAKRRDKDSKKCRGCLRPTTPLQKKAFKRFARLEKKSPHLVYPTEFKEFQEEQTTLAQACKDPRKKFETTPQAFAEFWSKKMATEEDAA
jgi:hypothetical protein